MTHEELLRMFAEQQAGKRPRSYPAGRLGADDDGDMAAMMALDRVRRVIVMRFPYAVEWLGLDLPSAEVLLAQLSAKVTELRALPERKT